ncbi:MAG: 1-acyl-sn-glycerol-3-phosphate acyltransferase [Saprospiraceae bacterium]
MLYRFLKVLVGFGLRIFYRNIAISGLEHIRQDRAQLIASNHPNGFIEPLVMACFFPKPLNFLVRGDVFEKKWLKPLLEATYQIPVFRFRDGFSKMKENHAAMSSSIDVLGKSQNLLIFVEGGTESRKQLRPIQNGISKIAFSAMEKYDDTTIEILPVGINFTYPVEFNSEVYVKIGKPISLESYLLSYKSDRRNGMDALNTTIYDGMAPNIIKLNSPTSEALFERVIPFFKNLKPLFPIFNHEFQNIESDIIIADKINALVDEQCAELDKCLPHIKDARKYQLNPVDFLTIIKLILGLIPALFGMFIYALPILIANIFTRSKVKQKEFRASILFVVTMMFILIELLFIVPIIFLILSINWYWYLIVIFLGLFLRWYYDLVATTYFGSFSSTFAKKKQMYKDEIESILRQS